MCLLDWYSHLVAGSASMTGRPEREACDRRPPVGGAEGLRAHLYRCQEALWRSGTAAAAAATAADATAGWVYAQGASEAAVHGWHCEHWCPEALLPTCRARPGRTPSAQRKRQAPLAPKAAASLLLLPSHPPPKAAVSLLLLPSHPPPEAATSLLLLPSHPPPKSSVRVRCVRRAHPLWPSSRSAALLWLPLTFLTCTRAHSLTKRR